MSTDPSIGTGLGDIEAMQAILDLIERHTPGFLHHLLSRKPPERMVWLLDPAIASPGRSQTA